MNGAGAAAIAFTRGVRIISGGGASTPCPQGDPSPVMPGWILLRAPIRQARKWAGSLSCSSNESQTKGTPDPCTQVTARVVFPYPAGAQIRVNLRENTFA